MAFQINTIMTFSKSEALINACETALLDYILNTVQVETSGANPSDSNHKIYQKRQGLCRAYFTNPKEIAKRFAVLLSYQYPTYEMDRQGTELSQVIIGEKVLESKKLGLASNDFSQLIVEADALQIFNVLAGVNQNDLI